MPGQSSISPDVVAAYAADATRDVAGVHGLVGNALQRHDGVRVSREGDAVALEVHIAVAWGASAPSVGAQVQERVVETLARMADVRPVSVDVVVDEFAPREG
jgi:uncharacterized alkaline shock family protein YloU